MAKKAPPSKVEPWADPGLKCLVTLSCLLREKGHRTLNAAIKKHVGEEDMYVSDEMEKLLVDHPLSEAELATFETLDPYRDWPDDLSSRLIPLDDGETEPFLVERWDDLVRLPNVRQIMCQREAAVPPPELLPRLPKLQSFVISTAVQPANRHEKLIPRFQASGFFISAIDYKTGWATFKRGEGGPSKEVIALLSKRFPKEVYRKGKGGFAVNLARVTLESGALVARLELTLFRPEDPPVYNRFGEHQGEASDLSLLSAKELAGNKAAQLLEERIDRLLSHVAAERHLPTKLT